MLLFILSGKKKQEKKQSYGEHVIWLHADWICDITGHLSSA